MFTGIVTAIGQARRLDAARWRFHSPPGWLAGSAIGDSIAVNGACLTITRRSGDLFECALSEETRRCCAPFADGMRVNLEQALAAGDKLGGHIVTGHVDGAAEITAAVQDAQGGMTMRLRPPPALLPLVAAKGSVALAGVSLTVNSAQADEFSVYLLAHTLAHTALADYAAGDMINIETDILARHIARLMEKTGAAGAE